jgi:hypothetical protein
MRSVRHHRAAPMFVAAACILVSFIAGCQDNSQPLAPQIAADKGGNGAVINGVDLRKIQLAYVCGNQFKVTNFNTTSVPVTWQVRQTKESGSLTLAAAPASGDPNFSETTFTTNSKGTVALSYGSKQIANKANGGVVCQTQAPPPPPANSPAVIGSWTAPFNWGAVAIHAHLLPDGRVLTWSRYDLTARIWNPVTNSFTTAQSASNLFCSSHDWLPNGQLLVAGGHITDGHGQPNGNIFTAATSSFSATGAMSAGRWYPTLVSLGDGSAVVMAGTDQNANNVGTPERWSGGSWHQLTGAYQLIPYYPRAFLAPNGQIFYAGESDTSQYLDPSGSGSWHFVARRLVASRDYGSAVMYQPGKIIYIGGGAPTATAEIIDLNQGSPSWRYTSPMKSARRQMNATILADGKVLATGGSYGSGFSDETKPVLTAELWNPDGETWTTMAAEQVVRVYHSTAVLLPDARVLEAGGGAGGGNTDQTTAEIFTPPYLYASDGTLAPRPVLSNVPATAAHSQQITVGVQSALAIGKVTLIRLSSVTHAFNIGQRILFPTFTTGTGTVTLTLPSSPTLAPAGPYMLFVLNTNGVPSKAAIITLQ